MKTLIVDDSKMIRGIERTVLATFGCKEIVESSNAADALRLLQSFEPDLAVVDGSLAGEGSAEFIRAFRQKFPRAAVILVTAQTDQASAVEAIKAGVTAYLVKPFTPDLLMQRIEEACGRLTRAA
ncbi:MAG TPA: response regulator [Phycisphaerales bacterium]|nr:response regulator [Phycisphaerales bacterium]